MTVPQHGAPGAAVARRSTVPNVSTIAALVPYLVLGIAFGAVLVKAEVISWYRIQEMFRFQSFHMYGIIGSAVVTAAVSVRLLQRFAVRTLGGDPITVPRKEMGRGHRYWLGGAIFGVGWALTGACPGPLFALVGSGASIFLIVITTAVLGTWTYGQLRSRLPH